MKAFAPKPLPMRSLVLVAVFSLLGAGRAAAAPPKTVSGIVLDAPWKAKIYAFARTHFHHPAWGWQHAERDYDLAVQFARGDGLRVDRDVLFAAAMMHDMAAFAPWETAGVRSGKVEHGDLAARDCVPILRAAGFPMNKIAAVQAAERGHMFYSKPSGNEAVVLHDADSVDFLGDVGIVRMLSLVGEKASSPAATLRTLRDFSIKIPARLYTRTARAVAAPRVVQMRRFLDRVRDQAQIL